MSEEKYRLIKKTVESYLNTFESKPRMLGTAAEVNDQFFIIDQINFILEYGRKMDSFDLSWTMFLIKKKYVQGAENRLSKILKKDDDDFELLTMLRREFKKWQNDEVESIENNNSI